MAEGSSNTEATLRDALVILMDAVGLNETHPVPGLGRCTRCLSDTITPRIKVCRKCAAKQARQALALASA
jgi:hypothetical protein